MASYSFIDRQDQLDKAVTLLQEKGVMAIDTESSGYFTYFQDLCLIQISSGDFHCLVDPLSDIDLSRLLELFANPGIIKIFHGAASDIQLIRSTYSCSFKNVFDTLFASQMVGHESCSLQSLVKFYYGKEIDKDEQKSDWRRRPLSSAQLDYAHADTIYLEGLMKQLLDEIESKNMREEVFAEFEDIANTPPQKRRNIDMNGWMRIPGSQKLAPQKIDQIIHLYIIREKLAREENIAPFRLLNNAGMMKLIQKKPKTIEEILGCVRIHPKMIKSDGENILNVLSGKSERIELPETEAVFPDGAAQALFKDLKHWRSLISDKRGISVSLILSNKILQKLSEERPGTFEELSNLKLMNPWKLEKYGKSILEIIRR